MVAVDGLEQGHFAVPGAYLRRPGLTTQPRNKDISAYLVPNPAQEQGHFGVPGAYLPRRGLTTQSRKKNISAYPGRIYPTGFDPHPVIMLKSRKILDFFGFARHYWTRFTAGPTEGRIHEPCPCRSRTALRPRPSGRQRGAGTTPGVVRQLPDAPP